MAAGVEKPEQVIVLPVNISCAGVDSIGHGGRDHTYPALPLNHGKVPDTSTQTGRFESGPIRNSGYRPDPIPAGTSLPEILRVDFPRRRKIVPQAHYPANDDPDSYRRGGSWPIPGRQQSHIERAQHRAAPAFLRQDHSRHPSFQDQRAASNSWTGSGISTDLWLRESLDWTPDRITSQSHPAVH